MRRRWIVVPVLVLGFVAHRAMGGAISTFLITKTAVGTQATSPPAPMGALVPGTQVTFTNTTQNQGPNAVLNQTITDPLPSQVVFVSAVASPGASLTTPAVGTNGQVTAVWDAAGGTPAGLTPPGVSRIVAIGARICPEAGCTTMSNTATVSGSSAMQNQATSTTELFPAVDLSIAKVASVVQANAGDSFFYVLSVANAGPSISGSTQVVDTLPPGIVATNVETDIPGASCMIGAGGQTVTCIFALGALNQCATMYPTSGTITIDVQVAANATSGPKVNIANIGVIGPCGYDTGPGNNTTSFTVVVDAIASPAPALSSLALGIAVLLLTLRAAWMLKRQDDA